jgi:glycosyltransferase involved in cell wall biosynthesis
MELLFDGRWDGEHGIGRFAREMRARLPVAHELRARIAPWSPVDPAHLALRLLSAPRAALFYSPGYNAPLASPVPFVFTIHDLNHIRFPDARTALKTLYYERVMKPACRRARAVVTVSAYSRADICAWSGLPPERVVDVGNGVGAQFVPAGERLAHPRPYVLCVGNRKPHKNEQRSLAAFAGIAARVPHDLLFTGAPTPQLLQAVQARGLSGRVGFLGTLDDRRLAAAYRGAGAVLFVSLYEGFGLPVIEAQACGAPVISSDVCSLPEVAGGAALLVDPRSSSAIAAALDAVLTDPELTQRLVLAGQANCARYSWERTGAALRGVLAACAS